MEHAVLYIALVIIAAFVVLSHTFSPIWLLVVVLTMLWPQRRQARARPVYLLSIVLLFLSLLFTYFTILAPFIVGGGLAFILAPAVDFLERRRVPATIAVLACLVPAIAVFPLLLGYVISGLVVELQGLIEKIPDAVQQGQVYFRGALDQLVAWGIDVRADTLARTLTDHLNNILTGLFSTVDQIGRGIGGIITVVYNLIIIPVSAYLFLADRARIREWLYGLLPKKEGRRLDGFITKLNGSYARFFRGQLVMMAAIGLIVGVTLWLLGIKYYLMLALIAASFNIIPNVGFVMSFIPAILIGVTSAAPLVNTIKIVSVYIGEQLIENFFLGPVIVGNASRLHPLVVMIALIIGGLQFGFWGVLLAIPVTIFVRDFVNYYLEIKV